MPKSVVALAMALAFATACRQPAGPAETYRAFAAAARSREPDAADRVYGMLSKRSRQALDARAKEVASRAPGGAVSTSGRDLVLGNLAVTAPRIRSVTLLRESRDAAVVSVEDEDGGGPREVSLVREDGMWRVVLPFDN